jgi:hypothetical protein
MAVSPSTDNYTLGRGIVYFDRLVGSTYQGERDMGNTPAFNVSVALEKLDHFSSRSGLKAKDKTVITQVTPTCTFTLDEINVENIALMFMANTATITQAAALDGVAVTLTTSSVGNRYYDVGDYRNIATTAILYLPYDGGTVIPVVGEVLTGAPSTDTGTVVAVIGNATEGIVVLSACAAGDFPNNDVITGSIAAAIVSNGVAGVVSTGVNNCLVCNSTGTTVYTLTTDFTIDSDTGRIFVVDGGTITDGTSLRAAFSVPAASYTKIDPFEVTSIEGRLRFVPDNPVGNNMECLFWRVDLTPGGEVGFISDEWQALEFTGEILKDETSHPTSPYGEISTTDLV